jgi:hypothetical protein
MKILFLILISIILAIFALYDIWKIFYLNKKIYNMNESFTIVPIEQTIEIDDLEVKPNIIVIMPHTVITWKNTGKHPIKLFINTETEQKMVVIDPNESWSHAYRIIRQYDYIGIRLFDQGPSTIGKVNSSISGRIIVTAI